MIVGAGARGKPTRWPRRRRAPGATASERGRVLTTDGVGGAFEGLWERRQLLAIAPGVEVALPSVDDLILTKRFASRPKDLEAPSRETRERLTAMTERRLSADEVRAALAIPVSEAERAQNASLIRWLRRRYPTPGERLAYARRAYRRWSAAQGR